MTKVTTLCLEVNTGRPVMSLWLREEKVYAGLPADRQANIEVVSSAYASLFAQKAYLTMPITTGKRFYDILDRYGARTVEELEQKRPGALREEIILPNIEAGRLLAEGIRAHEDVPALIVPGVFEARSQRWTQDEYMVLWLRVITSTIRELYLSPDWEYSNGGAVEFARAVLLQFRCIDGHDNRLSIYDHRGEPVSLKQGADKLTSAIKDLGNRGYDVDSLKVELGRLAGLVAMLYHAEQHTWAHHTLRVHVPSFDWSIVDAAQSVGASVHFHLD